MNRAISEEKVLDAFTSGSHIMSFRKEIVGCKKIKSGTVVWCTFLQNK